MPAILYLVIQVFSATYAYSAPEIAPLRFRLTDKPETLDWTLAYTSHETPILMNLMEGLLEYSSDGKLQAALAKKWEVSKDGQTYTFQVRSNVKWSDGMSLHASQFRDAWIRLLNKKSNAPYSSFLFGIENAQAFHEGKAGEKAVGIKVLGRHKLEIRLRQPMPHFPHLLTFWVTFPIRSDLIRKHGSNWTQASRLATLGPYQLMEWEKGKTLRMRRNPLYYKLAHLPKEAPSEIIATIEPDDARARELFKRGQLDFLLNATTQDQLRFKSSTGAGIRVAQYPYLATYYLGFQMAGPLRDRAIRQAIASVIDPKAMPAVLQGGEMPATSLVPPGMEGHSSEQEKGATAYQAQAALAAAGSVEGQGFPVLPLWIQQFDGAEILGRHISKVLQDKLGITVELRIGTPGKEAGFALFVTHWGADYPDPENFFSVFLGKNEWNHTGWKNDEYDELLKKASAVRNPSERLLVYVAAENILVRKEAIIKPLFYRRNSVLLGPRISEFHISPLNYLFFKEITLRQ